MPQTPYIITISDSRGRGLGKFLRESPLIPKNTTVKESAMPGADIYAIRKEVERQTRNAEKYHPTKRIIVVVSGGICSLTTKHSRRGQREISYDAEAQRTNSIKENLNKIWSHCKERGYYLIVTTIYPASLKAFAQLSTEKGDLRQSKYTEAQTELQQKKLEQDLQVLNTYIAEKASEEGTPVIKTHKKFVKIAIKNRKNRRKRIVTTPNYKNLVDGVHANDFVKNQIFKKIASACRRTIDPTDQQPDTDTNSDSNEQNWNFKRRKTSDN